MRTGLRAIALATVVVASCARSDAASDDPAAVSAVTASASSAPAASASASLDDATSWKRCGERIASAKKQPAEPGAPEYEKSRPVMAAVRGHSLMWKREPKPSDKLDKLHARAADRVALMRGLRDLLADADGPEQRRAWILREGYLWYDEVEMALALVEQVSLEQLFRERTIFLQRGLTIHELSWRAAERYEPAHYVYRDGPLAGDRAEILHGDRVAVTKKELEEAPPLCVDLRDLADHNEFDRMRVLHFGKEAIVAELRYGDGVWVPALVSVASGRLKLECQALTPELARSRDRFVADNKLRRRALVRIAEVARAMVREEIPFDAASEQTNGFLRKAWQRAYFKGWRRFSYEGKSWPVYTETGGARPPQVCIDFLTDAWERASGTWYVPLKGDTAAPQRTKGGIDFDAMGIENRRSVADFIAFTKRHPKLFDTWAFPKDARVPFKQRSAFFAMLSKNSDRIIEGDMLTIHGYKEGGRPHYHSVIVLEKDPLTGLPTLVAGNAVFAREQTLDGVMQISPKRSLKHRVRVLEPWLDKVSSTLR